MALSRLRTLEDFSFMVYRNLEQFLPVKMLRPGSYVAFLPCRMQLRQ